jgi:hypothetical protein
VKSGTRPGWPGWRQPVAADSEALRDARIRLDDVNMRIEFTSRYGTADELAIVQAQRDLIENEIGWLEGGQDG